MISAHCWWKYWCHYCRICRPVVFHIIFADLAHQKYQSYIFLHLCSGNVKSISGIWKKFFIRTHLPLKQTLLHSKQLNGVFSNHRTNNLWYIWAWPGRKQAWKHVRAARDFNNIETRTVIKFFFLQGNVPKEIHAILTETLACFLPGRAKDLSAPLYIYIYIYIHIHIYIFTPGFPKNHSLFGVLSLLLHAANVAVSDFSLSVLSTKHDCKLLHTLVVRKFLSTISVSLLLFHRAFFVHLVFYQLMHLYILLKYYHRQLL